MWGYLILAYIAYELGKQAGAQTPARPDQLLSTSQPTQAQVIFGNSIASGATQEPLAGLSAGAN